MILYIRVSSAYSFAWDETVEGRSLKNKRGPRTEPQDRALEHYRQNINWITIDII